jgi:RimJ/RimL family protein N-acetyltransferase
VSVRLPLETGRLVLRRLEEGDADVIVRAFTNERIVRNIDNYPRPFERADAEAFIETANRSIDTGEGLQCAVALEGAMIGVAGVRRRGDVPFLSYWIDEAHWGQGYAYEACQALLGHVFDALEIAAVHSGALLDNPGSIRVLMKLGFEETGRGIFHSDIRNADLPHINATLTRERYFRKYS